MSQQTTVEERTGEPGPPARMAVLGLGPMGTALAQALLAAGVPTTVWNRSAAKAEALRRDGAEVAADVAEALSAAELVVVCLRDHAAVREAVATVDPGALVGRTIVNLSSSTPVQARETAEWFAERDIAYLSGAIMVPTPLVGGPDALILYSGDRAVFDRHVDQLRPLAGTADHVGEDPGRAALYDVTMLVIYFAGMTSFLHAAAMLTAQGVAARDFLPYAEQIASLLPETFVGLAGEVDAGSYPGTEDRVAMELAALDHILETSTEVGLDGGLPRVMRDLAARTVAAGRGEESFSSVVEAIRTPS